MPGVEDLFWLYQNADTGILLFMTVGAAYIWKRDIQPRLNDLETVQDQRSDKWSEQHLNDQERDILLDNAHDRLDQQEQAVRNLRNRLQRLERGVAAETGVFFRGGAGERRGDGGPEQEGDPDAAPSARATVTNDIDVEAEPKDRRHGVDPRGRDAKTGSDDHQRTRQPAGRQNEADDGGQIG